jgi:diguanylate cyclase (GGDEF)-like protein
MMFPGRSPAASEDRPLLIGCLVVMFSICAADWLDGSQIWLYVFYVFPLAMIAYRCANMRFALAGLAIALVLQGITLGAYGIPAILILVNLAIAFTSGTLLILLARIARANVLRALDLAARDALTGVDNRRGFESALAREIDRQRRYGGVFSLIVLDLDKFKQLNDRHGHLAGDCALIEVANTLRQAVRHVDTIARIGGDEFAIVLPNTSSGSCQTVLEHIETMMRRSRSENGFVLTASIGCMTFEAAPASLSSALEAADRAMYQQKIIRRCTEHV